MTRRVKNQSPQEPRQAPDPSQGATPSPKTPPRGARLVPLGVLGECSACGTTIPSSNTTGVCVSCTYQRESVETKLARWDAIIEGQRRTQAAWGTTPAMLRAAARAPDLIDPDELEKED